MRKLENYKKGDIVFVHSNDKREQSYKGFVKSAGNKYITVCINENGSYPMRFCVNTGICEDWSIYELYHSEDEYNIVEELNNKRIKFRQMAEHGLFTDDEINIIMNMYKERTKN